jgi:hypothetical protein
VSEDIILNGVPLLSPPPPRKRRSHLVGQLILRVARKSPFAFGIVVLVVVTMAFWSIAWEADTRTETCTITNGQQVGTSYSKYGQETSSQNRITTTECGTLNVDDDAMRLRFGAGSDFASILPGETVRLTVVGWKGAIFSTLPNVVAIQRTS